MPKSNFQIDRSNLARSAKEALDEHAAKRMSYAEWKSISRQIATMQKAESFRSVHGAALDDGQHPEHVTRMAELQGLYEAAYPEE